MLHALRINAQAMKINAIQEGVMKIVVIGANAAGAKAASKAKRMSPNAEITVVDRGSFISYGACGIPYFVADMVHDEKELMQTPAGVVRTPEFRGQHPHSPKSNISTLQA